MPLLPAPFPAAAELLGLETESVAPAPSDPGSMYLPPQLAIPSVTNQRTIRILTFADSVLAGSAASYAPRHFQRNLHGSMPLPLAEPHPRLLSWQTGATRVQHAEERQIPIALGEI